MNIHVIRSDPIQAASIRVWVLGYEEQEGRERTGYLAGDNRWPSARWRPVEGRPCSRTRPREERRTMGERGMGRRTRRWSERKHGRVMLIASAWLIFFPHLDGKMISFLKNCKYAVGQCLLCYFSTGYYVLPLSQNKCTPCLKFEQVYIKILILMMCNKLCYINRKIYFHNKFI
jgi:hypothetical protein